MKHLIKFNEAEESVKYEMELKDYFYDFTDNGFVVDIEGNTIKGKYTGNLDSATILDTFLDVVTKLKHYYGIAKTMFYNTTHSTSFTIEVQHKPNENSIEVVLSNSNTKLILNVEDWNYRNESLTLYCMDIVNNRNIIVNWYSIRERCIFRIGTRRGKIDLDNVNKVLKNIINGKYKSTFHKEIGYNDNNISKIRMDVSKIDPNILVKE